MYGRVSYLIMFGSGTILFLDIIECVYAFRLGEGCSHMAAILFKVETAVRNGYTSTTSSLCQWNQVFTSKVKLITFLVKLL